MGQMGSQILDLHSTACGLPFYYGTIIQLALKQSEK